MLKIVLPGGSIYNENDNSFTQIKPTPISIEHSLLSISKWESIWVRSFFNNGPSNVEEWKDYIRCMTINQNVDPRLYKMIPVDLIKKVQTYCMQSLTATTVNHRKPEGAASKKKITTSELVYYWMIQYGIPFECEKWHISRLLMLIDICAEKANPPKKKSQKELIAHHRAVNAARRGSK